MRRVWAGLVFAAWVGSSPAQTPPARPTAPPAGDILVQKTAGQPERRLKLLRLDTGPDGERVADLQDLATGTRYTVPAAALAGMTRAPAAPAPASPPPAKPFATGGKFPTSLPLPEPLPGSHSPFVARPLTAEPPRRQSGWVQPQRPVAPAGPLDTPLTALVVAPTASPQLVQPAPPVSADSAPAQPVTFQITDPPLVAAPWPTTQSDRMRAEIEPFVNDLVNALRPSVRERAATALANSRHAAHPEVKGLLARTAMTDPAPTVQAHCVHILSKLGYHEREYVEFLELSLGGESPALRQAAAAALAKLVPR